MDKLVAKGIDHVRNVEFIGLGSDPRIEHNVQKHITQLFFDAIQVLVQDGVPQLVGFFDREVTKGFKGLFFVPGAFFA